MVSLALLAAIIDGIFDGALARKVALVGFAWVGINMVEQSRYLVVPLLSQPWHAPKMYDRMVQHEGAIIEPAHWDGARVYLVAVHTQKPMFGGMGENLPFLFPSSTGLGCAPLYTYLRKVVMDPTCKRSKPMINRAFLEGFRFVVLDLRLVNGLYLRYPEEKREERKAELIEKLKDLLGEPWLIEGPFRVWDLKNPSPTTEKLPYTPSGIGMQRSRLEQKLFELNRLE